MKITDLKNYKVVGSTAVSPTSSTEKPNIGLGQKILNTATDISDFFGGKGVADTFGAEIAKIGKSQQEKDIISAEQPTLKQTIGSGIQLGANLLPGVAEGAGLLAKTAIGAGTGYAFDVGSKLQDKNTTVGESLTPGVGTAVGGALPVGGAVLGLGGRILGRLFKGLGSGLSGVSTKTIDSIIENPNVAKDATEALAKTGNSAVLEKNAKQIINGVSNIRQEARKAFGEGLDNLSETDINRPVFKSKITPLLEKYGSSVQNGTRRFSNVEFTDPKNLAKASELVDKLSSGFNQRMDGKSLRKLADDIENSAYKTATSDERLSFNAFVKDLSSTLKEAISSSTSKLDDINSAYSKDLQLAEATEDIFGKVDYKNLSEVVKASQKLETLFSQKGLAPDVVDDFLKRIGIAPEDFKTAEAVRQISNKSGQANTKGLSVGEIVQQFTSSVITPQMVRDLAILTGNSEKMVRPFLDSLKGLSSASQKIVIQALLQSQE